MNRYFFAAGVFIPLLAVGCDRLCDNDDKIANVRGDWMISGSAECDDEDVSSSIDLATETVLSVDQQEGNRSLVLSEKVPVRDGTFELNGEVDGACVDFVVRETGPDYEVAYDFKGVIDGTKITGEVTGTGTDLCNFSGDFEVKILGRARPDGGVTFDAGVPDAALVDAGSSTTSTTTPRPRFECYNNDDCDFGACQGGSCVVVCTDSSQCFTGEACTSGRCEDVDGCNCNAGGGAGAGIVWLSPLLLLAMLCRRWDKKR